GWSRPAGSDYCFRMFNTQLSWVDANASCAAMAPAGQLASIRNDAELAYIASYVASAWLSFSHFTADANTRTTWLWATGADNTWLRSAAGQAAWAPSEPSNGAGHLCGTWWPYDVANGLAGFDVSWRAILLSHVATHCRALWPDLKASHL